MGNSLKTKDETVSKEGEDEIDQVGDSHKRTATCLRHTTINKHLY